MKKGIKTDADSRKRGREILIEAQGYFNAMWTFRQRRARCQRFAYGDQWSDKVVVDGVAMSEAKWLQKQGMQPMCNNLIRRLIKSVEGVWLGQSQEPTCVARDRDEQQLGETMSTVLQYNMQLNRMDILLQEALEEFLISGMVVHKKTYGWRNDMADCWTDYVQPNNFFIDNNMRDVRGWDCSFLGEIHDVGFNDVCGTFGTSAGEYKKLEEIYATAKDAGAFTQRWEEFGYPDAVKEPSFLVTQNASRCRVIEVWRKERRPRYRCHDYLTGELYKIETADLQTLVLDENRHRMEQAASAGVPPEQVKLIKHEWFMDDAWFYYFLSPLGDILAEGETPYAHKGHPYVFAAYPFIDGEIHSFVDDVIDQQKYVNRLMTLQDMVVRSSAKGVLLVPDDCLSGMSIEEWARMWSVPNGVLPYKPGKSGDKPTQIMGSATNTGISEMLNTQLKFFEDISGVNGALQGKPGYSGISAALYSQQTQNATTSLLGLLGVFNNFIKEGAIKDVKNIQQFYDDRKIINIAGRDSIMKNDPEMIRSVEFDLSIVQSTATPAYRALANDFLMGLLNAGHITIDELLEVGSFPFADKLAQKVQKRREDEAQQMQQVQQMQQGGSGQMQMPPMG